jgi:hypothetical protein
MSIRLLFLVLVLALLAGAAWYYRDTEPLAHWLHAAPSMPLDIGTPQATAPSAAPAGLRKCRNGAKIVYTSDTCPPGSVEQAIGGGAVTVVPGQRPAPPPAQSNPADPASTLRDALVKPQQSDLREKRMEQVIDK